MILDEVAALLKVLAVYDGRNVGEADLMVWGRQMADIELADAIEAAHAHYGETRDRAHPADIRHLAEQFHNRRNRNPQVVAPGCVEPDERERRRLVASDDGLRALPVADGTETDHSLEIKEFARQRFREVLPPGDPDSLRHGHKQWRQDQIAWKRQREAQPNPNFDPAMAHPGEWQRTGAGPTGAWWENEHKRELHAQAELDKLGRLHPRRAS